MADTLTTIEAYVAGDMTESERLVFAERLANEPDLQAQLIQYQDGKALLEQAVSLRLKKQMQQMQRPNPKLKASLSGPETKLKALTSPWLKWTTLAASFLLILAAGFWWTNRSAESYNDYFEPYALLSGIRGAENTLDVWKEAYQDENYTLAKHELSQIKEGESSWVEAQFYLGNISLMEAKPAESIGYFEEVLSLNSPRFETAAEWYLILAYWGNDELLKAQELSQKILQDVQHPYFSQIKRLEQQLE